MSRQAFFKQSGWMMMASVASGLLMFGVHFFAKKIPESEYGVFGTMMAVLNCLGIPAVGLQMMFVHQTASAVTPSDERKLAGMVRRVLGGTFVLWAAAVIVALLFQRTLLERWQISNAASLWWTLGIGLAWLWMPVFAGLLQGKQNFLWFGWAAILNGAGRLAAVCVIVLLFQGYAAGMVAGIFCGTAISLTIYGWHTRSIWTGPAERIDWKPWLGKVIPLTVGIGSFTFMMTADPVFVQAWFDKEETGFYMAAGTLARALVAFTGPVVWVMFPKIVRSVAISEKTDVMWLSLAVTAALAALGALGLTFVAPWLLQWVYKESYLAAVPLLRWFAWSMAPLTLANVLLNNLMARSRYRVVPWLVGVAALYAFLLWRFHDSFLLVIRILGLSNLLYLVTVLWFSCRDRERARS